MGYTTTFEGQVTIKPKLSKKLIKEINAFNDEGHYGGRDELGNRYPEGSVWCQWVASEDGTCLYWDGSEKFYSSKAWMGYIIDRFIAKNKRKANGEIEAQGDEMSDRWTLVVTNNKVTSRCTCAAPSDW